MYCLKSCAFPLWMLLVIAGCAVSPEEASRREAVEADIASVLAQPLDPAEYGEPRRCMSNIEIRQFEALDDRRILFEGRGGKLWLNTLRGPCMDLDHAYLLRVRSISFTQVCDMDNFQPADWFDWPWYRRWPWVYDRGWGMGMTCTFGPFQPVSEEQVAEIRAILEPR